MQLFNRSFFASVALIGAFGAAPLFADDSSQTPKEAELRAKVVDYMRAAANVEWTPRQDIPYWNPSTGFVFKKGEKYFGLPYTQFSRNNNLTSFESNIETVDGVRYYVGPSDFNNYCGSDCSASLSNAWKQADPNFPSLLTRRMIPDRPKEIVPVGDYPLNYYDSTPQIVAESGFETMKAAYSKLKPADAVIMHVDYDGHAMLVLKNDPENERLFVADQTGLRNGRPKGKDGRSTFRVDCEYSYKGLFDDAYIPVALKVIDDAANEIELFNGKNLDGWTVNVRDRGADDVNGVFTVQDGVLRVSGEEWGGIMTTESYSNYRLTVEFKWGEKTWGYRADKARDSGVLIHSFGPADAVGGVWAKSVEANLVEGGIGDFWIVGGANDGIAGTCDVIERDGKYVCAEENGKPVEFTDNAQGCFQWVGRSADWEDVLGFRGPCDVDRPNDWNTMTIYAIGDAMEVYVNGKFVNRVYGLKQTAGPIQLQSEGAEIFFRRVSLRPWNESLD